jgi:protein arginine N-methyltransferase 5
MDQISQNCFDRWLGEPVAVFELPLGFEESESTLKFARQLIQRNAQPVLMDSAGIRHIFEFLEKSPALTWEQAYIGPYHDQLQLPLQPLADNMENTVYETFEEDRMKYDLYEKAIHQALVDLLKSHKRREIRISVLGAGRGGLIDSVIRAISRIPDESLSFFIDGVEKNPNAARTLRYKVRDDGLWCSDRRTEITIVESDMRSWKPSTLVDIMVSELLGSLGDNEASPECIYGAWSCLNPDGGICIPQRYVSSLEPVSCEKAWVAARETHKLEHLLVSALHSCYKPCLPEYLFEFDHRFSPSSSDRSKTLSWVVDNDSTIHGFSGYFHCDLYGDVVLSIHPPTKSEDMVSWFPAFLPLKHPLYLASGQRLCVRVDRKVQADKLWFEWTVTGPIPQPTNNSNGAVYTIGLS